MDPHTTGVALLWAAEPTDRALAGWHPPVWLALGDRAIFRKEWAELSRWAPSGYTMRWFAETPPRSPSQQS